MYHSIINVYLAHDKTEFISYVQAFSITGANRNHKDDIPRTATIRRRAS